MAGNPSTTLTNKDQVLAQLTNHRGDHLLVVGGCDLPHRISDNLKKEQPNYLICLDVCDVCDWKIFSLSPNTFLNNKISMFVMHQETILVDPKIKFYFLVNIITFLHG